MPEQARKAIDPGMLALIGKEVEDADPIAWDATGLDRDLAYDIMASQIAETFAAYVAEGVPDERQMLIALGTVVKLSVENFVLHQRLLRDTGAARLAELRARGRTRP